MSQQDISIQVLSDVVFHMKYARYLPEKQRRETWEECVTRNMNMHLEKFPELEKDIREAYQLVYDKKVLPSMRSMQFSGKPINVNNARMYNCAALAMDSVDSFSETMFLLLSGCGVGFSVQQRHIQKLPPVRGPIRAIEDGGHKRRYLIGDSIEGWADAIKVLVESYFFGKKEIEFDFRDIRPKGALLVTSGGKAPGPKALQECIVKIVSVFERVLSERGKNCKLTSLEVHDIMNHISDAVLAGGIRRAAMISLFNIDDEEMLKCKSGQWWDDNPQRARANNTVYMLRSRIKKEQFKDIWSKVKASNSGEPGIYFSNDASYLTNPCFAPDTLILTKEGIFPIKSLVGKEVEIWDGKEWIKIDNFRITGHNQEMVTVTLSNESKIRTTLYHNFILSDNKRVEAKDLKIGDTLMKADVPFIFDSKCVSCVITDIENSGIEKDVYCCTVPTTHSLALPNGIMIGQCNEAAIKPFQFCNLTVVNVASVESQEDFNSRCKAASTIGTLQASYTDFHYLRDEWRQNTEKDALLGVSMTGIASEFFLTSINMTEGANTVLKENERMTKLLKINKAARTCLVKPDGSSSLLLGSSSGIHAWYDYYYLRRIRVGKNEAIYTYFKVNNPDLLEDDVMISDTAIIKLPVKAPENCITRNESPLNTLERVKKVYNEWIIPGHRKGSNTHNSSVTINIKENEWDDVFEWMWENRNHYNGISVLPYDNGTYVQAPFESITKEEYEELSKHINSINLAEVWEIQDGTSHAMEAACGGGACEIR